MATFNS